jgi:hypothetical protein
MLMGGGSKVSSLLSLVQYSKHVHFTSLTLAAKYGCPDITCPRNLKNALFMWSHSSPQLQLPGQAWPSLAGPWRWGAARVRQLVGGLNPKPAMQKWTREHSRRTATPKAGRE